MLWTIAVVLIVLWLLGLVSSYTLGGAIHVLLVIAIAVFLIGIFQGATHGMTVARGCRQRGAGQRSGWPQSGA